ncbi:MAG: AraC family transcriptional regulator [Oscillospiraceae bacterium]
MNINIACDILKLLLDGKSTSLELSSKLNINLDVILKNIQFLKENNLILDKENFYSINPTIIDNIVKKNLLYLEEVSNNDFCDFLITQRENNFEHTSFDREVAFYESICSGNTEKVKLLATPLCGKGYGILSHDELRNLKYHFTISVALITRFCINHGMSVEEGYNLSDMFILKADNCNNQNDIHKLHYEMIIKFTKRMYSINNEKVYSKQIVRAIDYISDHLHSRIKIEDIANYLSLSVAYLSRLFKAETGIVLSEYINIKKIESASSMLQFSKYTDLEISNMLGFSSQSYFIKIFKKYTGMTPKEYKSRYRFSNFKEN